MAVSNAKSLTLIALIVLASQGVGGAIAAPSKARMQAQDIVFDADSCDVDLANNNELCRKVRITQGNMSIAADQGRGTQQKTAPDFDNSLWIFRGSVKITMDQG